VLRCGTDTLDALDARGAADTFDALDERIDDNTFDALDERIDDSECAAPRTCSNSAATVDGILPSKRGDFASAGG
jgi:hypothetical protein